MLGPRRSEQPQGLAKPWFQGNDIADLADKHDHDSNTEPRRQKMIQTAVSVRTVVSKKS